jgi:hypothetical protein
MAVHILVGRLDQVVWKGGVHARMTFDRMDQDTTRIRVGGRSGEVTLRF